MHALHFHLCFGDLNNAKKALTAKALLLLFRRLLSFLVCPSCCACSPDCSCHCYLRDIVILLLLRLPPLLLQLSAERSGCSCTGDCFSC